MGVIVKALKNGPYEVAGGVQVLDNSGKEFPDLGDPVYLCRCGASKNKPYCDGSHQEIGFKSEESAG
jgi:CDGSH-type Zn-finger protein